MRSDAEQIAAIKSQTLARMAEITAQPKPTYRIDGQLVNWGDYCSRLQQTLDWCKEKLRSAPAAGTRAARPTATMTLEDVSECLDLLMEMVAQHCNCEDGLDSMSLSANAGAMRFLARFGLLTISCDGGRRVLGKLVDEEPNP